MSPPAAWRKSQTTQSRDHRHEHQLHQRGQRILPDVPIVFDRYHVMVLINRQIDALRREQQHHLDNEGTDSRFLLLRNYHELPTIKRGASMIVGSESALVHPPCHEEQLRLFWSQDTADRAKSFRLNWCFDALTSGIKQLNAVGSTDVSASVQGLSAEHHPATATGPLGKASTTKSKP